MQLHNYFIQIKIKDLKMWVFWTRLLFPTQEKDNRTAAMVVRDLLTNLIQGVHNSDSQLTINKVRLGRLEDKIHPAFLLLNNLT